MAYHLMKEKDGIINYVGKLIHLLALELNQLTHLRTKIKNHILSIIFIFYPIMSTGI